MANIVVFGKAQSGKSTLLGYLYSQLNSQFDINKFEKDMQNELLSDYESSYLYAYIMDNTRYERLESKGTRNLHVHKMDFNENLHMTVIDTPGVEHQIRPKQRGMFLGDIGIFCIELCDITSDNFLSSAKENVSIISTLLLWSNLGHKRIVVALTKCDKYNYSEKDYNLAVSRVHSLCEKAHIEEITVVPVAVLVSQKRGINIVEKSTELPWYQNNTLYKILELEEQRISKQKIDELLFCVHSQINRPNSRVGKVWLVKIIQGEIAVGDSVILTPVLSADRQLLTLKAVVKTIRNDVNSFEEETSVETAQAGEIVGVDFKNIYFVNGRDERIDKKDFDTIYTTCGFKYGRPYSVSDQFVFSVDKKYRGVFVDRRQFSLIWFGRAISFWVEGPTVESNDKLLVTARIFNRKMSLPLNINGEFSFTKLIIKDENERKTDPYYEGTLIKIGGNFTK